MRAADRIRANPAELAAVAADPVMLDAAHRIDAALLPIAHDVPQGRFVVLLCVLIANTIRANPQLDPEESIAEVGALVRAYLEVTQLAAAPVPSAPN